MGSIWKTDAGVYIFVVYILLFRVFCFFLFFFVLFFFFKPLFSRLPYVTLPGNHEIAFEFASYRHRFAMSASPGPMTKNMFWAFDYGRVRFVGIDGEGELDVPEIKPDQMEWLLQELNTSRCVQNIFVCVFHFLLEPAS